MHCFLEAMDLTYEDGWPSIPKIIDHVLAYSPMDKDQIGKW